MKLHVLLALGLLAVLPTAHRTTPQFSAAQAQAQTQPAPARNELTRAFKPGGRIVMDLSAGGYIVRGTSGDAIGMRWQTGNPDAQRRVRAELVVDGATATIRTRGPKHNFRVEIDVPRVADLAMSLSAGDVDILGIQGNKQLSMWAGDVTIEVGAPDQYKKVDASVRFGELALAPFGAHKGGILRSFHWNGGGQYSIDARLFAGDLKLVR